MAVSTKTLFSHELCITFRAPLSAENVKLTGTFDGWSQGHSMKFKNEDQDFKIFSYTLPVPEPMKNEKFVFKFVVDGVWQYSESFTTEFDDMGNKNNVIYYGNMLQCPNLMTTMISRNEVSNLLQNPVKTCIQQDSAITVANKDGVSNLEPVSMPQEMQTNVFINKKRRGCSVRNLLKILFNRI